MLREGSAVAVVEKPSSEEKGLSPAREYCYTVRAFDAAGNASRPSGPACATTPDLTPPSQPPAARALPLDDGRIEVAWRASTDDVGVVRYEVEPASGPTVKTSALEWVDRGLEPWTLRCYRVRAVDAAGNRSAPAGPLCARTLDVTPPTSPARPVAAPSSEVSVELSWEAARDDSPSGVVGYEIRRDGETIARTALTRASDPGRRPFTQYCYSVVAVDGAGNRSAPAGPACARTPDVTPPTAPRGLVVYPASDSQLDAFWRPATDNHGVAGYEVVRGGRIARVPGASAVESGLAPETEHCLRVRAYDAAGNRSGEAGPVCARTLAVGQPPPPRNVSLQGTPRAVLGWDRVPAPSGLVYRVYEDGNRIGATRFPSYTVGPAAGAKRRCYTVTTLSEAGRESPPSGEACTSPLAAGAASNQESPRPGVGPEPAPEPGTTRDPL